MFAKADGAPGLDSDLQPAAEAIGLIASPLRSPPHLASLPIHERRSLMAFLTIIGAEPIKSGRFAGQQAHHLVGLGGAA